MWVMRGLPKRDCNLGEKPDRNLAGIGKNAGNRKSSSRARFSKAAAGKSHLIVQITRRGLSPKDFASGIQATRQPGQRKSVYKRGKLRFVTGEAAAFLNRKPSDGGADRFAVCPRIARERLVLPGGISNVQFSGTR